MSKAQETSTITNGVNPTLNLGKKVNGLGSHGPKGLHPELDVQKLHSLPSEQQDLHLFQFSVDLESYADALSHEEICSQQGDLAKQLVQVIGLSSPNPSKAVRRNLGRTYGSILGNGNRKILFETVNQLCGIINQGKGEKELQSKHAAVHCLGEVYKIAGDSAVNLSGLASSSIMRLLKSAQHHAGLRAAIFRALEKIIGMIQGFVDETIARDIWKQGRAYATADKAALVQARACKCLEQLIKNTKFFDTIPEFETLKTAILKSFDSPLPFARHAAASCLATALIKSHTDNLPSSSLPKIKKPKKPNKNQVKALEDGEENTSRPASPSGRRTATKLELSLPDILRQLSSHYHRPSVSNKVRAAIAHCYVKILHGMKASTVESNFRDIADHILVEFLNHPSITYDRYRLLLSRRYAQKILSHCVGLGILGETGQINAARVLINETLKNFPQVLKEVPEPSKHTLIGALDVLTSLIKSLGPAFNLLGDSCREALVQVLQHPSYSVQIHASHCLREFVLSCPHQLLSCASICMNSVSRELGMLNNSRQSPRRCVGYANGLAAVLSMSPSQPLYGSLEICSRVLNTAIDLLKSSSKEELRVAGIQVQIAWILIGGLMALGPNFVKIHLSQFLLLWRNALPKPLTKDNTVQRSSSEISYLTHIRECTLGAVLSFLEFNRRLVTTDIARRIAMMLQNTVEYLDNMPRKKQVEDTAYKLSSSLQLQDVVLMVRRRVLQCYSKLISFSPHASGEILSQSNILTWAVTLFADPDSYAPGSLGSSIANAAGNFDSIWDFGDNSGFGITGLVCGSVIKPLLGEQGIIRRTNYVGGEFSDLDEALMTPICGAYEHDSVCLYTGRQSSTDDLPDPPATELVNAAIVLFATALPLQNSTIQEGVLEQLATFLSSSSLQRDPGRRAAVTVNAAMALLGMLKVAVGETIAEPGDIKQASVERSIEELLRGLLLDQDRHIRQIGYEGLGRLCNSSGNIFTSSEVDLLIETIVSNRDPNARSGCAMALGSIHAQVGGMAAGLHMKKIHGVLSSLCSDPNPIVHFCAIEALSQVADSAGLTFSGHVSSTLGLLAQLWTCDSHNEESAAVSTSNTEIEWPTAVVISHSLDSLVNVLGPDLQDMKKSRDLMLTLMNQFALDDNVAVQAECLRAWEHVYLYDAVHVELAAYVHRLQRNLISPASTIKDIAIDGLYNLMRRDPEAILSVAREGLEDQIWLSLNDNPNQEGIRNLIQSWLGQSSLTEADKWVSRCQYLLTKASNHQVDSTAPAQDTKASAAPDLQDEEVAGFNVSEGKDSNNAAVPEATQELLKWQTRAFALQCLSELVAIIGKDMELDPESSAGHSLQSRIADVIRLAFLASTASVVELQVRGLRLIDQILRIFGSTPDPDFSEALLLEQYQAQVSSALTPAFGADSSPDLAAAAVDVCATFIAAGLVTDVDRMGRILKLLVTALESFTDEAQDSAIGDLRGLSPNAQTMVRMAVLSAWAELQVASIEQEYLVKVMKPHVAKLTPLWLSSLQEFARLRFEPDISNNTGPARPDEGLDVIYAALNRQTLLKFYQDSWLKLVDAIASLIDQDSDFVFDALDRKTATPPKLDDFGARRNDINYRDEPTAFFFVLFGIVIESLITRPGNDSPNSNSQTLGALSALKRILRPSVSGNAVFQDAVFAETMELFDRLALTEGLDVQLVIVDIARNLCLTHPSAKADDAHDDNLSDDIEQLFELTRIIVLVLVGVLPNLAENNPSSRPQLADEAVATIQASLESLVDASDIFPSIIKADLHASILHIFATILGTGACQARVVPQAFPIFKRFLQSISVSKSTSTSTSSDLVRGCLHRFLNILSHAQRREAESSLPCAKNTLLATTILLTTASRILAPNDPLITVALDAMLDCLQDIGLAKVVASCLRSLLTGTPKNETDEAITRYLFPHLLRFTVDTELPDPENARTLIAHALTSFVTTTTGQATAAAMSVVIPMLLKRASAEGKATYEETAARLLELAGGALMPTFRSVVGKMSVEQRSFMETVIREGGGTGRGRKGSRGSSGGEKEEPSIALKMTFGGK